MYRGKARGACSLKEGHSALNHSSLWLGSLKISHATLSVHCIFQGADGLPGSPGDPGEPGLPGLNGTDVSGQPIKAIEQYAFLPELVLPSTGHPRTAW